LGRAGAVPPQPSNAKKKPRMKKRSRAVKIFIPLFFVLLVVGVYLGHWELTGKFAEVEKGQFYRSAEMRIDKLVSLCRKHGIRTVIDLRTDEEKARIERASLKSVGLRYIHMPSAQIPSRRTVKIFLKIMDNLENRPVLIHCAHGIGRTGLFSAIYRIEYQGWSNSRALLEAMLLAGFGSFLPNSKKAKFISAYVPSREAVSAK